MGFRWGHRSAWDVSVTAPRRRLDDPVCVWLGFEGEQADSFKGRVFSTLTPLHVLTVT